MKIFLFSLINIENPNIILSPNNINQYSLKFAQEKGIKYSLKTRYRHKNS